MNAELVEMVRDLRRSMAETRAKLNRIPTNVPDRLYNVHKRSVPISLDRIVAWGLTKIQAAQMVERLAKKERKRRENEGMEVVFLYDIVPVWPTEREKSIFYNEGPLTVLA